MKGKISIQARKELLGRVRDGYQQATRKQKRKILDGFIATTGYGRKYAMGLLNGVQIEKAPTERRRTAGRYNPAV